MGWDHFYDLVQTRGKKLMEDREAELKVTVSYNPQRKDMKKTVKH